MKHQARFIHRLRIVARAIARAEREDFCVDGATVEQFHALLALREVPGLPTTEIARWLGISVGTASRNLGVLERRGFVSRERDGRDGRQVVHTLTSWGEMHVNDLDRGHAYRLGGVYWRLGGEHVVVVDALGVLGELLAPREMDDDG